MTTWNYRIIKRTYDTPVGPETQYELVEAYYNDKHKLEAYTKEPIRLVADTAMNLMEKLREAYLCCSNHLVFDEDMNEIETIFGKPPSERYRLKRETR